jgi:hypothetical protein
MSDGEDQTKLIAPNQPNSVWSSDQRDSALPEAPKVEWSSDVKQQVRDTMPDQPNDPF